MTEFEFKYWVASYDKTVFDLALELDFDGPMGKQAKAVAIAAVVAVGLIFCAGFCCCVRRCKRARADNKVVVLTGEAEDEELKPAPAKVGDRTAEEDPTVEADAEDGGAIASSLQPPATAREAAKEVEMTGRTADDRAASPRNRGYVRGTPSAPVQYAKNPL